MFLMRFTERAYTNYTEADVRNSPNEAVRLTFSNSHLDPKVASRQYNQYLDEYEYSEEMGFDGLMLNEHHNTPTCLGATMIWRRPSWPGPPRNPRSFFWATHFRS
jgi:alkanesulfonate monooxygenase SsuD/methylene tetrahydromethanopterin reductase-like flavin-dependent oxidoreductase (luciferase family)